MFTQTTAPSVNWRAAVFDLVLLSAVMHFTWEVLQAPLFSSLDNISHYEGIKECARATVGDVLIALAAFGAAMVFSGPKWLQDAPIKGAQIFIATGLLATVVLEYLNTEIFKRWSYSDAMPRLPLVGTGLSPVLQWIIVPLIVLWYLRRLESRASTNISR